MSTMSSMSSMSRLQRLKMFVSQRLTAAVDDILRHLDTTITEYEQELQRRHQAMLDERQHTDILLLRKEEAQQNQWHPHVDQEEPEPPHIKEEEEELWSSQEQLPDESDVTKFTFSPVPVKMEEDDDEEKPQSFQLYQSQTEEDTEDCGGPGSEPAMNSGPGADNRVSTLCAHKSKEPKSRLSGADVSCRVCKLFRCSEGRKSFGTLGYLKSHMRCHTGEKPYRCPVCRKCFTWSGRLQKHLRIHTGEKPFSCTVCGKGFIESGNLKVHMRIHTGGKPFSCNVCGKGYAQSGNLKQHMVVHRGENVFSCNICDKWFTWLFQLKSHKCIDESSQLQQSQTEKTREDCGGPGPARNSGPYLHSVADDRTSDSCVQEYKTKDIQSGGNKVMAVSEMGYNICKLFTCTECGKSFGSMAYLKSHMRCHTGEKPYRCPVCRKCFSWSGHLQKHLRIHTGEKPFSCSVCGKGFIESGNLKVHMRIHTGEKPFNCSVCGKRYRQKGSLTKHQDVHRGEN